MAEGVDLVDHEIVVAAVAEGVGFFDCIVPADHSLASGGGAELELFKTIEEWVRLVDLRKESMGTDLGIVSLGDAENVERLDGKGSGVEEFGSVGVGSGDVGREALAFVEPVGLAEFADSIFSCIDGFANEFANIGDLGDEFLACGPIDAYQVVSVEGKRFLAFEDAEIEIRWSKETHFEGFFVGAEFGGSERFKKRIPYVFRDLADVLNDATGAVGFLL